MTDVTDVTVEAEPERSLEVPGNDVEPSATTIGPSTMATVEEPVGRLDEGSDRRVCKLHIGCGTHYINGFNMLQSQTPTELEWNLFRQFVRTETSTCFRFLDTGYTTLQRFTDGEIPGRSSNWRCFSQKPPWKKRISQLSHL
jgi:hypothetical protein